jgi:hypothetical protein
MLNVVRVVRKSRFLGSLADFEPDITDNIFEKLEGCRLKACLKDSDSEGLTYCR